MDSNTGPVADDRARVVELALTVDRELPETLGTQIERQLRAALGSGELRAGARLPSTRDLAGQLGVSRRLAVDAYAQLAAEGRLVLRQGARPRVAEPTGRPAAEPAAHPAEPDTPRYDFRPSRPDVSTFPRAAWARSLRHAVSAISDAELLYGDPRGVAPLRAALADYLGRVRGVTAPPEQIVVTNGYLQGFGLTCRALKVHGVTRIVLEDPSSPELGPIAERAGLTPVPVPVDDNGIDVDALAAADTGAVVLTPAHQHPTGVVLAPQRRIDLVRWLRDTGAYAIEDDYDAEYRYDRAAVKALHGLAPDRVVYAGSTSKTLSPALRLGWLAVPADLLLTITEEKLLADQGTARIEQHALEHFLTAGMVDRHLRRMRLRYRTRRDALLTALQQTIPDATVHGIAAGLHLTLRLPARPDEQRLLAAAARRRLAISTLSDYRADAFATDPVLLLGYAQIPEQAARQAVRELAAAIAEA